MDDPSGPRPVSRGGSDKGVDVSPLVPEMKGLVGLGTIHWSRFSENGSRTETGSGPAVDLLS